MIKLIRTVAPENGMAFEEICSFETNTMIGIWNHESDRFVLFAPDDIEFHLWTLPECKNLAQLDQEVYNIVEEHIIGVSDSSTYNITIEETE